MTIEELVKEFEQCVTKQTEAMMKGNPELGNRYANRCFKAFDQLRRFGNEGRDALGVLLNRENPDVRSAAAVFLLRYKTREAKAVLEEVAKGKGLIAFEAQQALKRWEEGTWSLDPADDPPDM